MRPERDEKDCGNECERERRSDARRVPEGEAYNCCGDAEYDER
jgi:hypothetical protein